MINLKDLREQMGFSQAYLAKKINISQQYYSKLEEGKRRPSPKIARKLAVIFNIPDRWYEFLDHSAGKIDT